MAREGGRRRGRASGDSSRRACDWRGARWPHHDGGNVLRVVLAFREPRRLERGQVGARVNATGSLLLLLASHSSGRLLRANRGGGRLATSVLLGVAAAARAWHLKAACGESIALV